MIAGMEDSGTLQSLTFLNNAGRVDLQRVLVLRTVSNYDREPIGGNAADSLKEMVSGNYSAYMPALEAAETVGDKVVRDIVTHWSRPRVVHSSRAVADIFHGSRRKCRQSFSQHQCSSRDILRRSVLVRTMAVSVAAGNEQHCRGRDARHETASRDKRG